MDLRIRSKVAYYGQSWKNSLSIATAAFFLFYMMDLIIPYEQQQQPHFAYAQRTCIDYDESENTITITCDTASFRDVADTINDQAVLSNLGNGEYLLNANLEVDDGATFSMSQNDDGIKWLKIASGANGIIVNGRIEIDGVRITSWDTTSNSPVFQTSDGLIPRAYINLRGSESDDDDGDGGVGGSSNFIRNSEVAYLGYQDFGKRGFDLLEEMDLLMIWR